MTVFTSIVVFVIAWWLILLALLPIGVRGQHESADFTGEDGTEPGAPQEAGLKKKFIWATIGATLVTLLAIIIALSGFIQPPDVQW